MSAFKNEKLAPVRLTPAAVEEIKNILTVKGIPADYYLRIGTAGGGCSGVSYIIGFDKHGTTDELYHLNGINVIIDKKHAMFLWGLEVDFLDSEERGFVFHNTPA